MRVLTLSSAALIASSLAAAEMPVQRDVPYAEPKHERQTFDVYMPAEGAGHPVLFFIHGGGWRRGDKGRVERMAEALVARGVVLVSTNYRFFPQVTVQQMTGDVAQAIACVHRRAADFGADGRRIVVSGHSAGAHLAALVCTDEQYLKAAGVSLEIVRGCVPIDVSVYDIPLRLKMAGALPPETILSLFGRTEEAQRALSPAAHVAAGKHIPPFLILHVASRDETRQQSQALADQLRAAGIAAEVFAAEGKTHGTIRADIGLPGDAPTAAIYAFMDRVLKP